MSLQSYLNVGPKEDGITVDLGLNLKHILTIPIILYLFIVCGLLLFFFLPTQRKNYVERPKQHTTYGTEPKALTTA